MMIVLQTWTVLWSSIAPGKVLGLGYQNDSCRSEPSDSGKVSSKSLNGKLSLQLLNAYPCW